MSYSEEKVTKNLDEVITLLKETYREMDNLADQKNNDWKEEYIEGLRQDSLKVLEIKNQLIKIRAKL